MGRGSTTPSPFHGSHLNRADTVSVYPAPRCTRQLARPSAEAFRRVDRFPCALILSDSNGVGVGIIRFREMLFGTTADGAVRTPASWPLRLSGSELGLDGVSNRGDGSANAMGLLRCADGTVAKLIYSSRWFREESNPEVLRLDVFQVIPSLIHETREAKRLAAVPHWNPNPVLEFGAEGCLTSGNRVAADLAASLGRPAINDILTRTKGEIVAECLATGKPGLRLERAYGKRAISWSSFPIFSSMQSIVTLAK